jgi:hypothetical protein
VLIEQAGIVGFGMLDHRRVRLQRNVNGDNWILLWPALKCLPAGSLNFLTERGI